MSDDLPSSEFKPVIGITMGDPAGIGPEIIVKALADIELRSQARFVIYGMNELLAYAADLCEIEPYWWRVQHDSPVAEIKGVHDVMVRDYDEFTLLGMSVHKATRDGGKASLAFLNDATDDAMRPEDDPMSIDAIATAPVCKVSWKMAGCRWPGHTEFLQNKTRSKRSVMLFASPRLNVALATIHVPLMDIRNLLTIGKVFDPIDLGNQACRALGIKRPRIAVCGLNPHAGEGGLFGDEEARLIEPAIQMAREHDIDVHGPFPADTIFQKAAAGKYDLVIAMYHDQGLIPVKLLSFDSAVNVTLGLPIIRTSVDHGTAFDIVGKNKADASPMKAALKLAIQLAKGKHKKPAE